ncbi:MULTISPECIES: hypothetical protein [Amycolatopsis]|uniref:Uncharacterized protein n=1 Tax=Amycolatopsis bullii TaxID=941987 RepID=A0ABQ3K261_9PSEU|nr:hypothetical protein [Amycolatopsis bullii]GHF94162.1 hypothetical protein GCM10017567_05790 [Amycolatopsis bullii]
MAKRADGRPTVTRQVAAAISVTALAAAFAVVVGALIRHPLQLALEAARCQTKLPAHRLLQPVRGKPTATLVIESGRVEVFGGRSATGPARSPGGRGFVPGR